jgi:hypothetical protein
MKVRVRKAVNEIEQSYGNYFSEYLLESSRGIRWTCTHRNLNSITQNAFNTYDEAYNECVWYAESHGETPEFVNEIVKETKYYFVDFAIHSDLSEINPEEITEFVKNGKATENWIFKQIDFTIGYTFDYYDMPRPKYVFVNRNYKQTNKMDLVIVRDNFKDEKEAMFWNTQKFFIQSELNRQAEANSDEDGLGYKFVII